jgi:hypothetical protein
VGEEKSVLPYSTTSSRRKGFIFFGKNVAIIVGKWRLQPFRRLCPLKRARGIGKVRCGARDRGMNGLPLIRRVRRNIGSNLHGVHGRHIGRTVRLNNLKNASAGRR